MKPEKKSRIASALGRLAKGRPKTLTAKERKRRSERMKDLNRARRQKIHRAHQK